MPIIKEIYKEKEVENIWGVGDLTPIAGEKERNKNKKHKRRRTEEDDIEAEKKQIVQSERDRQMRL